MPTCSASTRSHPLPRRAPPRARGWTGQGDDHCVERAHLLAAAARASAAPPKPRSRAAGSTVTDLEPRSARAALTAAARSGSAATITHERGPLAPGAGARAAFVEDRPEPAVAAAAGCLVGLGRRERRRVIVDSSTPAIAATSSVRTTSSRRGGRPPRHLRTAAKITCSRCTTRSRRPPGTHPSGRAARRWASSRGDRPPVGPDPAALPRRPAGASPAVTIRVAAIGDSALTVTPARHRPPDCQVSAATARLAQL